MPGIGIIANPHSKLNKRSPTLSRHLREAVGQKGIFTLTRDLDHLDRTIEQYRDAKLSIVAINGGDGTISQTLTRMIHLYGDQPLPKIAILRGGTMNLIARQLGIRGKPAEVLQRLLEELDAGALLPTLDLGTMKIGDTYGFLYADQSSVAILEEFYRKKSGHLGASVLSVRLIHSFLRQSPLIKKMLDARRLSATFDRERPVDAQVLGCFAGTISKLPMGIPLLPLARKKAGYFQTTLVTCKPEKLLWYLPLIMLQQKDGPGIGKESRCARRAVLRYEGEVRYTIDGEIYHSPSGVIEIEAGPEIPFLCI